MSTHYSCQCCILGAGPAGLAAAVELSKNGVRDILIIDRNSTVGGLSRTESFDGFRFDVGPHRFFTKSPEINRLWHEMLGADFRPVDRLTRIFYKNKLYRYPIRALDALPKLGLAESLQSLISFAQTKVSRFPEPKTFEEYITQKFGHKLFETFFKTYTEKVWGIPCSQIGAEWAAQRIKGLDIVEIVRNAFPWKRNDVAKTLVDQFDYPVLGAGQMYEAMADQIVKTGGRLMLSTQVKRIRHEEGKVVDLQVLDSTGVLRTIEADHFFSSIPLTHFFRMLCPEPHKDIRQSVESLYYREHISVDLLVDGDNLFPDQWMYIHSPDVQMARLANYNNFSKAMVKNMPKSALSVEYFAFQHEPLWKSTDEDLKALAIDELAFMGLLNPERVEHGWIVRETESYPTYYLGFAEPYAVVRGEMDRFKNVSPVGRGGLFKYNNQDHSTMSGLLAARNYLKLPGSPYVLWNINIDAEYHEAASR